MKKIVFLCIFTVLGIFTIHSQNFQNSNKIGIDKQLSQKDWSDIGTSQYAIGLKTQKITIPHFDFIQDYKDSILLESRKDSLSNSQLAKMPVYEPDGVYKGDL